MRFGDWQHLREEQTIVWGSTEIASRVKVGIRILHIESPRPCARFEQQADGRFRRSPVWLEPFNKPNDSLPYALFPFQGVLSNNAREIEKPPASFIEKGRFVLTLECPDELRNEVETSVWAWVNFGGLGSRTRRGCGSLTCKSLSPSSPADFTTAFRKHVPRESPPCDWPVLNHRAFARLSDAPGRPIDVWNWTIGLMRHFRQGPDSGRNPGPTPNQPGRSRFPEAETIRKELGRRSAKHARQESIPDHAFPRAELGLPIVFHFKDERDNEPPQTLLCPPNDSQDQPQERMASPVILKPLAMTNGQAIPLIVVLQTTPLSGVTLRQGNRPVRLAANTIIRGEELARYPKSPLAASPAGSALDAFLAFARDRGFQEVTP
jgi:CRISPR-associated protein Cmr1